MYLLTKSRGLRLAAQETLGAICALFVAEMFYRFHSFTLECAAFLATWYGFSWLLNKAWRFGLRRRDELRRVPVTPVNRPEEGRAEACPSEMGGFRRGETNGEDSNENATAKDCG